LGVCGVLEGVKDFFESDDAACFFLDGFPDDAVGLGINVDNMLMKDNRENGTPRPSFWRMSYFRRMCFSISSLMSGRGRGLGKRANGKSPKSLKNGEKNG
jgi:hypothetical protein